MDGEVVIKTKTRLREGTVVTEGQLDKEIRELLLQYLKQKLVDPRPLTYDRLLALPDDCRNERDKRVLKTAIQYCLGVDGRPHLFGADGLELVAEGRTPLGPVQDRRGGVYCGPRPGKGDGLAWKG